MTFQKPPPYPRPKAFADLFGGRPGHPMENTTTVAVAGGTGPAAMSEVTYVLERGVDSAGSPPMSFVGGQQHGPVSLGSAGDFRVEGRGVLETHGYLIFDGEGIYLCSADTESPLVADGKRIPSEWTAVGVPCTLVLGRARVVLRTAVASVHDAEPQTNPRTSVSGHQLVLDPPDDAATPYDGVPSAAEPATPYTGIPHADPPQHRSSGGSYRPRVPSHADEESTLVAPDRTASASGPHARFGDDVLTKRANEVIRPSVPDLSGGRTPPPPPSNIPLPPGYAPPLPSRGRTPHVYPPPPPLAPAAIPQRPQPATVATRKRPRRRLPPPVRALVDSFVADLALGSPRRVPILVGGAILVTLCLGTLTTLIVRNAATARAGASATARQPTTTFPPNPVTSAAALGIIVTPAPVRPAQPPAADNAPPTLERTAVDVLGRGDIRSALTVYRQLAAEQPDNPAFALAVKTLEAKAAAAQTP